MRFLLSFFLGLIFIPAFVSFFLLSSIVSFVESPEPLLESARNSGLRQSIVELTADYLAEEIQNDVSLKSVSVQELQVVIAGVITESWLEESLRAAHHAFRGAIHGAEDTAVLNMRETKEALRTALSNLKGQTKKNCGQLLGEVACRGASVSERAIASYERRALRAVSQISDEIDLLRHLKGEDREEAEELRKGLESLETMQMLSLVILIMSLALLIALNNRPLARLLKAIGGVTVIASAFYLLITAVGSSMVADSLAKAGHKGGPELREFSSDLVSQLVADSIGGSALLVVMIGLAGVAALVVGFMSERER